MAIKRFVIERHATVISTLVVDAESLNEAMDYARKNTFGQERGIRGVNSIREVGLPSYKRRKDLEP